MPSSGATSPDPSPATPPPSLGYVANLKNDLPASLVVFFVAVPLCLGIALASNAPLISGLIAGIVGGIVVGLVSGSPLGVSGPAAGLAVIVLGAIQELGFETFLLAVVIAGAIQVALGVARAGILGYFFPSSVIKGMLAGIGIIIFLKQIPHAFGHDTDPEGDLAFAQPDGENTFSSFTAMLDDLSPSAIVVSITCLAILILWDWKLVHRSKVFRLVQGPLVAVGVAVGMQWLATRFFPEWALAPSHLVNVPVAADLDELLGMLRTPAWSAWSNPSVWVTAMTLAVVASLETLLCVEATDKLDPLKRVTPTNRELVAQGVGNIASGAIGGLPVTQVIVRSSANIQSGGRTKTAAILHGVLLVVSISLLPQVLNLIPLAALAAILLVVGYKLASPKVFRQMIALGPAQFVPFVVTIVGIVLTDLLVGIALGMGTALFLILRAHYRNSHFLHMRKSDSGDGHHVSIELAEEVTFLNKAAILKELQALPRGAVVEIDATRNVFLDQDALEILQDFEATAPARGITVRKVGELSIAASRARRLEQKREASLPA